MKRNIQTCYICAATRESRIDFPATHKFPEKSEVKEVRGRVLQFKRKG